jgi:hypothetical protein
MLPLVLRTKLLPLLAAIWMMTIGTLVHGATLELVGSVPANNTVDISRTDSVALQFSAPLARTSVTTATVMLQSAAGLQKVALSVSGATVSVRPSTPLLPWTRYTLNATSLIGTNGEQLATPVSISFKTRDASWQAPQQIYNVPLGLWGPTTASNAKGVRFIVWIEANNPGVGYDVWATRQVPGQPSTDAVLVASFPNNYVSELNVFVDDDGNAFATWVTNSAPLPVHIWVNRFSVGSGWGTPQIINGNSKLVGSSLHLAFDHVGNALALWKEYNCCTGLSYQFIVANRYTAATGWSKPTRLNDSPSLLWGKVDIQADNAGNAYATWSALKTTVQLTPQLQVSRYTVNVGWSTPQIVATEYTTHTDGYQALAVNPRGEAFLMWSDDYGLAFAHADSLGNWSNPISIDSTTTISPSQMVLLDNGQAFAVFAGGVTNFVPDKGWWTPLHRLQTDQSIGDPNLISGDPEIIVDRSGNALVAWAQLVNHIPGIYAKRYRSHWGWLSTIRIDIDNPWNGAQFLELSPELNGSTVVTWLQSAGDSTMDMKAAHFE